MIWPLVQAVILLSGLTRVGVTQFWNGQTSVDIPLGNYASKSSLENQIHGLPFYENSHEAIPSAGLEKLNQQIGNTTARKRFVLMVTNGEETTASTPEKEATQKRNVTVFVIGCGEITFDNLEKIALPNGYAFTINHFPENLKGVRQTLRAFLCSSKLSTPIPPTSGE